MTTGGPEEVSAIVENSEKETNHITIKKFSGTFMSLRNISPGIP
jgi:hypothetical protein